MLGISVLLFFLVVGTEGRGETETSNLVHMLASVQTVSVSDSNTATASLELHHYVNPQLRATSLAKLKPRTTQHKTSNSKFFQNRRKLSKR